MSPTTDRTIRDKRMLLAVIAGMALVVAAAGVFLWPGTNAPEARRQEVEEAATRTKIVQPAFRDEPLMVTLYYPLDGMLASGAAPVKRQPDTQAQARETLTALLQDHRSAQAAVLREISLRAFYLDGQGTAYIDITPAQQFVTASAWDEQLALYAMVDTVIQNFDEIKDVRFLVDGRTAQTLAGHIDLLRTFRKRTDLGRH